ncbi:NAD(P)H-dependent oxidoreductase [Neobacillus sp. MM2021_6]|uniref:FMN-dependent NADH-azoreductase n=1 Tax=Bacillaceae TaxID=186817 RepID=UPI00140DEA5A|nr:MULTISPECIES: NAD(P)H-dependent oxidoreductase [Bacillaceae]MBO0961621.1 NAD(P)H-dependent oxidoreductase [Neobacillus sp. MM2021_6]NHC19464.1 NAD(P)H dehydrogenase [Bacillus sp. MM2020_4]WML38552.1 NAD(P)H-dependent oxidoreductase [Neobacillus sp. OS1-2]
MEKLLYVTANPKGLEKSKGLQIGEAFLETFKQELPDVQIKKMDLFTLDFAQMDADLVSARGKLAGYGYTLDQLTDPEREKILKMHALADEFISYDYYVFVSPMWNLSSPAVLKAFLDNLFVAGKTFVHTPNGPKGLLTNKKAIHIQTRGGQYTGTPMQEMESGDRYLKIALRFLGIEVMETILAEGFDLFPQKVTEIIGKAKENARLAAKELAIGN